MSSGCCSPNECFMSEGWTTRVPWEVTIQVGNSWIAYKFLDHGICGALCFPLFH